MNPKNPYKIALVLLSLFLFGCKDSASIPSEEDLNAREQTPQEESNQRTTGPIDYGYGPGLLPLGDEKISNEPKIGFIYSCDTQLNGGGAFKAGEWINESEGYWDPNKKIMVDGDISWANAQFTLETKGTTREIKGNGLPINHNTGTYPISTQDEAYLYDRNPNSIKEQKVVLSLPVQPTLAATPRCASGMVAIALNGIAIFNGLDAGGKDAVAHEIQDQCDGHPQKDGQYHYHNLSNCLEDTPRDTEHSALVGYALDGFGLYGKKGENGKILTNADLDECHGHTHEIKWEGSLKNMYHYHATEEYPYTIGCFKGNINSENLSQPENNEKPSMGPPPTQP
ncbi:MAG: hypothetical protein ACD_28C00299G0005 [uncultured bacterium]|nr:MAG: hypothetical protein ACD_28C00299G0005 [uncultured bacterium]KKT76897.1 MAG: hypothetical protein UW70_C0009G0005 [Candidatus Peregrinibacteria bacterium GW2011_GWA2_44_7]